jgi:Flp pilus assembly protein TadD
MAFDRETALPMMRVSLRLGDYPRASGIAARLVRESPQDAPLILDAAKALLAADRKADARPVLAAIGESAPLPEAGMLLGRMYLEDKDFARGAVQFAIAGDSFPEAIRLRGDCLAETGDFAGAAAEYAAHYDRLGDQESLRALAGMYGRMKSCPKESEALQLLVSRKWADDEDKLRLANLTAGQGDETEAMRIYDALLTPKSVLPAGAAWSEAAIAAGIRFARDGKLEKAIHALNLGLKNPPPSLKPEARAEAWNRLGECLIEKKMWRGAVTAYAAALTADSLSGEAAAELLAAARQAGAKREMEIAYRAVYRLDTLNEEANAFLASERRASRDYKAAAMHFRRVADNHPKDAKAWEDLGNALAMVPDLTAARGPLQTAIDLGAQSDEVYINRARVYRKEGAEDMAASIMDFLLERNAHDYLAILWSAKFAEEDGKQNIALEMFRKSARLSAPRTPWPELANQGVMEAKASLPTD